MNPAARSPAHRALALRLLGGVAAAFAFGFRPVPLYDVILAATGLTGHTRGRAAPAAAPRASTISIVQAGPLYNYTHTPQRRFPLNTP